MTPPRMDFAEKIVRLTKLRRSGGNFLSLSTLSQLLELPLASARVAARRLEKRGILSRVGPALYANLLAEPSLEQLAVLLWPPSYISLEWALAYHGVITQKPHEMTCVTLQRPRRVRTALGTLSYCHLSKALFFGFRKVSLRPDVQTWLADPEKALLDWIYLRRRAGEAISLEEIDPRACRPRRLARYARLFPTFVQANLRLVRGFDG